MNPSQNIVLNTVRVTYGIVVAPYLVLRVLGQLVEDKDAEFLLTVPVLRHKTYVDDCALDTDDKVFAR